MVQEGPLDLAGLCRELSDQVAPLADQAGVAFRYEAECASLLTVGDAALLPDYFAPEEADLIYINFCDPWPPRGQAKRRLTHRGFLETYRKVLKPGGRIEFKTDNQPLFEFSLKEFPAAGYELSEVTRNLHENGPQGVMTDYEAKFYEQGLPINRCVGTMVEWTGPEPEE